MLIIASRRSPRGDYALPRFRRPASLVARGDGALFSGGALDRSSAISHGYRNLVRQFSVGRHVNVGELHRAALLFYGYGAGKHHAAFLTVAAGATRRRDMAFFALAITRRSPVASRMRFRLSSSGFPSADNERQSATRLSPVSLATPATPPRALATSRRASMSTPTSSSTSYLCSRTAAYKMLCGPVLRNARLPRST